MGGMPVLTAEKRVLVCEALRGSETQKQIADRLDCSVSLVAQIAAAEGLQRTQGRRGRVPDLKQAATTLRDQGMSLTAIGAELGGDHPFTRQQISRLLKG